MTAGGRRALAIVGAILFVELLSYLAIVVSRSVLDEEIRTTRDIFREQTARIELLLVADSNRLLILDSVLGWRYRSGHNDSINGTGVWGYRGTRSYGEQPARGVTRVAAFGNSFVYCNEVSNAQSWGAQLERAVPSLEVLNYGVGGYGLDQAYLRFLAEGNGHNSHVAVLGFAPDDLGRLVNVYRRFRSNREQPLFKPRFRVGRGGTLELLATPVPHRDGYERLLANPDAVLDYGSDDQWFEPAIYHNPAYDYSAAVRLAAHLWIRVRRRAFDPDRLVHGSVFDSTAIAFRIQVRIFAMFADTARARGLRPVILFLPDRYIINQMIAGERVLYAPMRDALTAAGLTHVDALDAFRAYPAADANSWFMPGGHYSVAGNAIVARWLATEGALSERP